MPQGCYKVLKSYLSNRHCLVKYQEEYSHLLQINYGVRQRSILGSGYWQLSPMIRLYQRPTPIRLWLHATWKQMHKLEEWLKKWRIQANEAKSKHITFTICGQTCPPVTLNNIQLPQIEKLNILEYTSTVNSYGESYMD